MEEETRFKQLEEKFMALQNLVAVAIERNNIVLEHNTKALIELQETCKDFKLTCKDFNDTCRDFRVFAERPQGIPVTWYLMSIGVVILLVLVLIYGLDTLIDIKRLIGTQS